MSPEYTFKRHDAFGYKEPVELTINTDLPREQSPDAYLHSVLKMAESKGKIPQVGEAMSGGSASNYYELVKIS